MSIMGKRGNNEGSIRQRKDGKWEARISIGYTDDGKLKRISKYFDTRKEAATWLAEVHTAQRKGDFVQPDKITVADWMPKWLEAHCKPPLIEDTTYASYESIIRIHIVPGLGTIPLQKLLPSDIQGFLNGKLGNGRADGKPGGLSTRTVRYMHFLLQAGLEQAKKEGLMVRNVAEDATLPKMEKWEPVYLTQEEVDHFLDVAEKDRLSPALLMEMGTGLRRGELLGLKWADIDFKAGTVTIRRQLVLLNGKPVWHDHLKTRAGGRTITLPDDVLDVLRFYQRRQDNEKEFCGDAYEDSGLVFCQPNGRRISPRNFVRHFDLLLEKKAGIRHIPFHATRHTHATELLAAGVDLKTIQKRLGHSSFHVTADFYAHIGEELQKDAAAKANQVLNRRKKKAGTEDARKDSQKKRSS